MNPHQFLITGGAGFIGSHFVKELIRNKVSPHQIIIIDKLTYASDLSRLESLNVQLIEGDITDSHQIQRLLKKYEISCVVNFAAETHVDNSIISQEAFVQTNIIGVQKLLEETQKYWSNKGETLNRSPLFVQISTDEVYGSSSLITDEKFTETSPLNPKNPYAATKASADMMISAFINTYNYPAIIIRSTNNYGVGQHKEKLIPKVMESIINNEDIPLYGDGMQRRTWLNVEDNCRAIMQIVQKGIVGECYNVVGPASIINKELVQRMISLYVKMADKRYKGSIIYVDDRPGHDVFYRVDDNKINQELNFVPLVQLETGLKKIIEASLIGEKQNKGV